MEEIWKDIKGWEGHYQISNLGRVKNINYFKGNEKILEGAIHDGYLRVHLRNKDKDEKVFVHRLVAEAFIPNPENLPIINHKSEVRTDNRVENLEWCDYLYNARYGTAIQRKAAKLSKKVNQYTLGGDFIRSFDSTKQVEKTLGIFATSIASCCRGEHKTCGGYIWKYAD